MLVSVFLLLQFAQFDLDIREIDIMMQMGAYGAAEDLYNNGKHILSDDATTVSEGMATSLSFLATSAGRSVVPQFDSFVRFYEGNEKYADDIVRDALANEDYSPETKRLLVVRTCQYMIMFMTALQGMHEAIGECEANDAIRDASSAEFWDKAAASIIGHLEGTENGGSGDGMLFFGLAKQYCDEFGTCSSPSSAQSVTAEVNGKIVALLYAGRGAVLNRSCPELRKATAELEPLLLVSIIQATLGSSERILDSGIRQKALSANHIEAYIYGDMVLPLIEDVDRTSAQVIQRNLDLTSTPLQDGLGAVVEAFFLVYDGLGLKCTQVGRSDGVDACNGTVKEPLSTGSITGIVVGVTIAIGAAGGIFWLLRTKRKENGSSGDDKPVFVTPGGEMSHTDDLLAKSGDSVDEVCPQGVDEPGESFVDEEDQSMIKPETEGQETEGQEVV